MTAIKPVQRSNNIPSGEELTPRDIALRLQISERQAQEMCASEKGMRAYKIGKLWRVSSGDLERFLEAQKDAAGDR